MPSGPFAFDVTPVDERSGPRISRRSLLLGGLGLGLSGVIASAVAMVLDYLTPRGLEGAGGWVRAGNVSNYPAGSKTYFNEGNFWLVHLTPEQGGPGLIALEAKCTHLGCKLPWRETFSFANPADGQTRKGWFRCPCHAATFDHAGERVFGPAPRSLDRFDLRITNGSIRVNTGLSRRGTEDNARHATPCSQR